jgi:hypothetical protein
VVGFCEYGNGALSSIQAENFLTRRILTAERKLYCHRVSFFLHKRLNIFTECKLHIHEDIMMCDDHY